MLKITLKARLSLNNYIHIWCPKGKYILKSFKFINDYYIINNFDSKITKYIARAPTTTTALPKLANLNTLRTPPFSLEKILDETSIKTFPVIQKYVFSRLQILQGSISPDSSYRVIQRLLTDQGFLDLHLAFTQCITVGFASVIVCFASVSLYFTSMSVGFVLRWSASYFSMF